MCPRNRGIVICGGGFSYFTNSWIAVRLLRHFGCSLPIEVYVWKNEYDVRHKKWLKPFQADVRILDPSEFNTKVLPKGTRWQWVLKPLALSKTKFRDVLLLDADSFPVQNPEYLFDMPGYRETGAIFWPDINTTKQDNPIWAEMGLQYRTEPEFESGQIVIDTVWHREPLEFALQMNVEAEKYYRMIWGDKDTFRFAFHKYGRPFVMPRYPVQLLALPGRPYGDLGVMCQHDFEGNRIFQHRNMAKWDLLGPNAQIAGYLFEEESRQFLAELRTLWNGRLNWMPPRRNNYSKVAWRERERIFKELTDGRWLVEDQRPRPRACCGPIEKWTDERISKPWGAELKIAEVQKPESASATRTVFRLVAGPEVRLRIKVPKPGGEPQWNQGVRCQELAFAKDLTISAGASPQAYWWDLEREGKGWELWLSNEEGTVAKLRRTGTGAWSGTWLESNGVPLNLKRLDCVYAEEARVNGDAISKVKKIKRGTSGTATITPSVLHIANHAFGIGDAITGLYAAVGAARAGHEVIYHTRFPRWMARASQPGLTVTDSVPPPGTPDMDTDHAEQLRYGRVKAQWYVGRIRGELPAWTPWRPDVNREIRIRRVDFPRYMVISPYAAWESRDWPEAHWRRLAHLIKETGCEIVAIGTEKEEERITRTFEKSYAYWAIKKDDEWAEWVTDLMLGATAVIGLDSGMIHMAGLLGIDAVSIHAHLAPEFLFACARTIRSVAPQTSCRFCRWQEDRGYNEGCTTTCSALATVGPERVMSEIREILSQQKKNSATSPI